jgi:hypothetical protein
MEELTAAPVMVNRSALEELYMSDIACNCLGDLVRALFSQTTTDQQKLDFTQLSAALSSLQVSFAGVLLDTFRANTRPEELQQGDNMVGRQLWERIQHLFPDPHDQRLAFLLFHCNLCPNDILRYAPQEFRDKQEICHLRRDMLDRILQHSDLTH